MNHNTAPISTSVETKSDTSDHVSGEGSRHLKSEKGQPLSGVIINPDTIEPALTADGYPLIASVQVGDGRDPEITKDGVNKFEIIDMRNLPIIEGAKQFRGSSYNPYVPYLLVGRGVDGTVAAVGLRPGQTYEHGRVTAETSKNDRRQRFSSNASTSRRQFGIYVNEQTGEVAIYDDHSANGTSVEWGANNAESIESIDETTIPRAKLLGGLSLEASRQAESFASIEEAIADIDKKYGEFAGAREYGRLAAVLTRESDIENDRILANAGELVIDLKSLQPEHIDMMGLQSSFDTLRAANRSKDVATAREEYARIVAAVGNFVASRSRWFDEKYNNNSNDGYVVGLIARIPQKHFRRTANESHSVNGKPTLEYLKSKLH